MNAIKSYIAAWKDIAKYRYPIIFLFLANIIFTFIVTSPFTLFFKKKHLFSDALDIYDGYDISAVMEFVNNYGQVIQPFNVLFVQIVLAYFIFGIFTNSGVIYAVISQNRVIALRSFWNGGLNYFWKILRLSIYYLLGIGVVIFLIIQLLFLLGINILEVQDDRELTNKFLLGIFLGFFIISFFSTVKQYAKVFIAIDKKPLIGAAIFKSSKFIVKNFVPTMFLYLINIGSVILFFTAYFLIKNSLNVNAWVILFIVSQALILFKIIARIIHLDSTYQLYKALKK